MNVQLHNAITDLSGVTGQAIVRAILTGERDPAQLAALRDYRIRASQEEIINSLRGDWKEDVLFELQLRDGPEARAATAGSSLPTLFCRQFNSLRMSLGPFGSTHEDC